MNFPVTGALVLVFGVYCFIFSPSRLYAATVFLIPFSATAVVNLGWRGEQKGIAAWIFVGALWMLRASISSRPPWRRVGWSLTRRPRRQLLLFLLAGFASLCVPLLLSGTVAVRYFRVATNDVTPLRLDMDHVTQTVYLVFGVLITILVAVDNCDPGQFLRSIRIYTASAIFVVIWGLVQFWCNVTGNSYPSYVFNTNLTESAQLYNETIQEAGLTRIASVADEPSMFAQAVLLAGIFLLIAVALRRPILSKRWDWAALLLTCVVLILSTATTAYVGMGLAAVFVFVALKRAKALRKSHVAWMTFAGLGAVAVSLSTPFAKDFVALMVLGKGETGSGLERIYDMSLAAHYFSQYPLLGLGWGSVVTPDLVLKLLSNTGLVGFLAFLMFLGGAMRRLWGSAGRGNYWSLLLLAAVCLMITLSEVSGFPYSLGHLWFVLGLGVAAPFLDAKAVTKPPASTEVKLVRNYKGGSAALSGQPSAGMGTFS